MKRFQNKQELQHYVESLLKAVDVPYEREKLCSADGLRAGIVTSDAVIEVRAILNQSVLYQAIERGKTYQHYLKKSRLVVMGQIPNHAQERQMVKAIAKDVIRQLQVEIVFIEGDGFPKWDEDRQATRSVFDLVLHDRPQGNRPQRNRPQRNRPQGQTARSLLQSDWFVQNTPEIVVGMITLAIVWIICAT